MAAKFDISSKTKRARLEHRLAPYFVRLRTSGYVGYYVPKDGSEGTWIARYRGDNGKQQHLPLGTILEGKLEGKPPAFDRACKLAAAWFDDLERGARPKGETVEDVCKAYVEDRKKVSAKNGRDAEGRFKRLVYSKSIGKRSLAKLRGDDIRKWLNDQIPDAEDADDPDVIRRAKDSANRNLTALKAALNLAFTSQLVASDVAWRSVKPFKDVGRRRDSELTIHQRKALLKMCPPDLANFCKAVMLTAARPGEIAATTVGSFSEARGDLRLSGKTGHRTVPLSTAAIAFFKEIAKYRIGRAPMIPRPDGQAWDRFTWRDAFSEARAAAKLSPDVVLYTLRHVAISEMLAANVNPSVVAKLAGTSTAMIDKHYHKFIPDKVRERLDEAVMY